MESELGGQRDCFTPSDVMFLLDTRRGKFGSKPLPTDQHAALRRAVQARDLRALAELFEVPGERASTALSLNEAAHPPPTGDPARPEPVEGTTLTAPATALRVLEAMADAGVPHPTLAFFELFSPGSAQLLRPLAEAEVQRAGELLDQVSTNLRVDIRTPGRLFRCIAPMSVGDLEYLEIPHRLVHGVPVATLTRATASEQTLLQQPFGRTYGTMLGNERLESSRVGTPLLERARAHAVSEPIEDIDTPFTSWTASPQSTAQDIRTGGSNVVVAEVPADQVIVNPFSRPGSKEIFLSALDPRFIKHVVHGPPVSSAAIEWLALERKPTLSQEKVASRWPGARLVYDRQTSAVDSARYAVKGQGPGPVLELLDAEKKATTADDFLRAHGLRHIPGTRPFSARDPEGVEVDHPQYGRLEWRSTESGRLPDGVPFEVRKVLFRRPDGQMLRLPVMATRKDGALLLDDSAERPSLQEDSGDGRVLDALGGEWLALELTPAQARAALVVSEVHAQLGATGHQAVAHGKGVAISGHPKRPILRRPRGEDAARGAVLEILLGQAPLSPGRRQVRGALWCDAVGRPVLPARFAQLSPDALAGWADLSAIDQAARQLEAEGLFPVVSDALRRHGLPDDERRAWLEAVRGRFDALKRRAGRL